MTRACVACGKPTDRHVFEDTQGNILDAFCDDHCPRCFKPKPGAA